MPSMISYEFGDIVLAPFPFTDQSSSKKRPAVVISSAAYNQDRSDLIIMAITSQLRPSGAFGEVIISAWQAAGLLKPSAIKPVLTSIERGLILRKLGRLEAPDRQQLQEALQKILGS
jgi:mRNA-degrading endonuclease toxin of MazEF toxin-antitoxin module